MGARERRGEVDFPRLRLAVPHAVVEAPILDMRHFEDLAHPLGVRVLTQKLHLFPRAASTTSAHEASGRP
ncbi:MAG TPA: hypothetical protein VMA31_17390, partial [Bryobacteraceae bacterium]|nr:hypothetical protein [Bryobacteraceae bacterium]